MAPCARLSACQPGGAAHAESAHGNEHPAGQRHQRHHGVSGQAIIGAILQGQRDPWKLADLKDKGIHASREEVARSLEGNWREDVIFELQQAVDGYHFANRQMRDCDQAGGRILGVDLTLN